VGQKPKTTIEINGRRYDAITGELVTDAPKAAPEKAAKSPARVNPGGTIDGMMASGHGLDAHPSRPAASSKVVHLQSKAAKTLNRAAVNQPTKTVVPAPSAAPVLIKTADKGRLGRAQQVSRSQAITKFGGGSYEPLPAALPVVPPVATGPTTPAISAKDDFIAKQLAAVAAAEPARPAKLPLARRVADKFKNKRSTNLLAGTAASLLLVGYITYLNIPRMALRLAASRAGFSAEMPSYSPSGFNFSGPVAYAPGEITVKFASNTDQRYYDIHQQQTSWDSQSLLDNFVLAETELYSTYQERGLTVYIFGGTTATWVNGGIWFTIAGESNLTAEQLLKIASSL